MSTNELEQVVKFQYYWLTYIQHFMSAYEQWISDTYDENGNNLKFPLKNEYCGDYI